MNDVPQLPRHLGLEDVKGLVWMQLAVAFIVLEEAIVRALVPLKRRKWSSQGEGDDLEPLPQSGFQTAHHSSLLLAQGTQPAAYAHREF